MSNRCHICNRLEEKINVIPKGLEKYMVFIFRRNLIFIDSTQFMNSSLKYLIKNLPENKFRYLSQELCKKQVKLVKKREIYPYEYMNSAERFDETKLPDKKTYVAR